MAPSPTSSNDRSGHPFALCEVALGAAIVALLAAILAGQRAGGWLLLASMVALALTIGAALAVRREVRRLRVSLERERDARVLELDATFAHAPVGLVFHDREGHHLRGNPALAQVGGVPPEQMIGKTVREVAPAYADEVERCLAQVFDTGQAVREVVVTGPMAAYPGELRHLSLSYFPICAASGEVVCAAGFVFDITERKRAEAELQASYARLSRLWESNILGVLYANADGEIVDANDALLQMLGYTREEFRAGPRNWKAMTPPELLPLDARALVVAEEDGACMPYEKVYLGKGGRRVPVLLGFARLAPPGPDFISFVIDLTERARLLESERFARAEAERACRAKDDFVAIASHELRTPLHAILGWAQMLQRGGTPPEQLGRALAVIERNARQLAEIVSDLLDVSRMASGKTRLDLGPVVLCEVVDTAAESLRDTAEAKGVALHVAAPPAGGALAVGDASRLVQVVSNLLGNAIKFTPPGGRVEVGVEREEGRARIRVVDTGEGIAPELLPHLFERFRQGDASTTRRHGGLGLGLAIVKHLVDLHGGVVRAESPGRGAGARFEVELPLALKEGGRRPEPARPGEPSGSLAGVQVLLVEDDPDACELARRILEERGAAVVSASSAPEALAALERAVPDVLVSDIGLPGMDGYELLRRLRAQRDPAIQALPAAALTAFARPEDREHALAAGFSLHLAKPIDADSLVAAVAQLAGAR